MLRIGDQAPEFGAHDQDDKLHRLGDYKGKWVLLFFYPKDDTPGCTKEACGLRDHFGEIAKQVVVIGISKDSVASHTRFAEKYQLPFTLLSDPDRHVIKLYDALTTKKMFGKKFEGTARISYLIDPQGIIAKIYPKVNPAEHAQDIIRDLDQMQK